MLSEAYAAALFGAKTSLLAHFLNTENIKTYLSFRNLKVFLTLAMKTFF